jgi:uncharacterized protein (DUF2062 family)
MVRAVTAELPAPKPGRVARWKAKLRANWETLKAEHTSPARLGVAMGVGVFCGCSPFHGFQVLLSLGLAWVLKLNKLATLLGLQISAPPVTPLIVFAGLQFGALLLHGRFLPLRLSGIREVVHGSLWRGLLTDFVVGSLALGVLLGLVVGVVTTLLVRRYRAKSGSAVNPA